MRQTAGVIEHKTFRQERMTGARQTQATQVFVIPECPSPRKAHPHCESNEESPGRRVSLAQSGARSPNGLPAESMTKPICSRKDAPTPRRRLRSPRPSVLRVSFVLRRDRRQKTRTPEVNQESRITAPTIRERTNGDLDPRRNRNGTYRKPSCLALCGKQQA